MVVQVLLQVSERPLNLVVRIGHSLAVLPLVGKEVRQVEVQAVHPVVGLNPYSNGIWIERLTDTGRLGLVCLNPYSNGIWIELAGLTVLFPSTAS